MILMKKEIVMPETFKPHDYQKDAIEWILTHNGAGLFLPPGLGKTPSTLMAIKVLLEHKQIDRVLVVAPLRVCYAVWPNEVAKWEQFKSLSIAILHGEDKDTVIRKKHAIYVINPECLKWLFQHHTQLFVKYRFMLVLDESTLFKNHSSQRFHLLKSNLQLFARRVILTGTPAPNGLIQLWPQVFVLDFGKRLGKFITHFRNKYFDKSYDGWGYELKDGADEAIYAAINDIVMHKSHDEIELPERIDSVIQVILPKQAIDSYNAIKNEFILEHKESGEVVTALNAASQGSKLKQIANGIVYSESRESVVIHTEKVDAVKELVESLAGRPLLVVYEHLHELALLKKTFGNAPTIGGGTSGNKLAEIIRCWNAGNVPILFLHPRAGGHGLNLQYGGCHDVVWFSIPFDLELYDQVNARVHRQGVKNSVTIHHIAAKGTVDYNILGVLKDKAELQNALLEAVLK